MVQKTDAQRATEPFQFVLKRTFDAPRDLVWRVWTDAAHLARWFGPKGMGAVQGTMDLRVGGTYHYSIPLPDGGKMWGLWTFREIDPPRRLVTVMNFSDENRGVTRHPFQPGWPLHTSSELTFKEVDGKTVMTLRSQPFEATAEEAATFESMRDSMRQGWGGTTDKLDEYLKEIQS